MSGCFICLAARIPARVQEMMDHFGLCAVMDALPDSLPLGMRQRLSLVVAVIHGPDILILDEPTSASTRWPVTAFGPY